MSKKSEEAFEQIANGCIERCEAVDCSLEEFVEGLTSVIVELEERRNISLMEIEDAQG